MKEQVTDISKVLQGMTEEMRLLRATVNQQYSEIVRLNLNIYALSLQISKLKIRLKYSYTFHFDFGVDTFLEVYLVSATAKSYYKTPYNSIYT
jgi:hypothetical protein